MSKQRKPEHARLRTLWLALALCLTLAVVVVGCGDDDDEGSSGGGSETSASTDAAGGGEISVEPKTIAYIDVAASAAVQGRCFDGVKAAADKLGWEVEFTDAQGDPAKALTAAQNAMTKNVDAIIASSMPKEFIAPVIAQAKTKDVPTVAICGGIQNDPEKGYDAAYGEDETVLGQAMTKPVIEDIEEDGGKNIVLISDNVVEAGVQREAAFRETLAAEAPDAKILAAPKAVLADPNGSVQKIMTDLITQYPDIDKVFTVYDWMVAPAATILRQRKLDDKIKIYSGYADFVNLPFLRNPDHPLKAVAEAPLLETGLVAVDQLLRKFEDGEELDAAAFDDIASDLERYPTIRNGSADVPPKPADKDVTDDYQLANLEKFMAPYVERWQQDYGN